MSLSLPNDTSSSDILDNGLSIGSYDSASEELGNSEAQGNRNATTISIHILPDNVLLEIFDQYRLGDRYYLADPYCIWRWHLLVHVCRKWRQIISASPRRLDLQLACNNRGPFREMMGIWPTIPIIVSYSGVWETSLADPVIAALEHPDRVSRVNLFVPEPLFEEISMLMQEPFTALTYLSIVSKDEDLLVVPNGFLGGSAPSLQYLFLCGVVYSALPRLLLSTSNLVYLELREIPPSYIPPEAMVSCVAASPKLEDLFIEFSDCAIFPDLITLPPTTRTVLPTLCEFSFAGECKYLEDFVSRIDTPQLNCISVCYWNGGYIIDFGIPQLSMFIDRSEGLKRTLTKHCKMMVNHSKTIVGLSVDHIAGIESDYRECISVVLWTRTEEHILGLTRILRFISPILSDIVHCQCTFDVEVDSIEPLLEVVGSSPVDPDWLQSLRQLSSLQTLIVLDDMASLIYEALAHVDVGTIADILPALQLLYIGETWGDALEDDRDSDEEFPEWSESPVDKFLALRRASGRPVTFVETHEEFEERLQSYL